ncbi:MAG: bifunctional diaminohydroxyphosphoribosylaminopyrimidine deaminase/5-amino-6-(5-phosphoribosylamino)uracil reductase RibD [Pyrinomonadaceae bacterium]
MAITEIDIAMIRRAFELARAGVGLVSPNPLVGCVIVSAAGEIVGEGTYIYDNVIHAEAIALDQAGELAIGSTAYVSLEPHDHHGKTNPCTEALINAGVKRIVCPIEDPNPLVSGAGISRLRDEGLQVDTGVLSAEAAEINEKFICWHRNGRPFVHLKLAVSLDGRISLNKSVSTALSGDGALKRVHEIRHDHDAILVGSNTVLVDDPNLTDRSGKPRRRELARVVLDNRLQIPVNSRLVRSATETPTIVFSNSTDEAKLESLLRNGVSVPQIDARDLNAVLAYLRERDIQSILVEGGSEVAGAFCDAGIVDKITFMMAPIIIGGRDAPPAIGGTGAVKISDVIQLKELTVVNYGGDIEITGYPGVQGRDH